MNFICVLIEIETSNEIPQIYHVHYSSWKKTNYKQLVNRKTSTNTAVWYSHIRCIQFYRFKKILQIDSPQIHNKNIWIAPRKEKKNEIGKLLLK